MKIKNYKKLIFFIIVIGFIVYFFFCMPSYIRLLDVKYYHCNIQYRIESFFRSVPLLDKYYHALYYKISDYKPLIFKNSDIGSVWGIPVVIIIDIADMVFGFRNFRGKWWYYAILVLNIVMCVILRDCFDVIYNQDAYS